MTEAQEYKKLLEELTKSRELIETSLKQSILELEQMGVGTNDSLLDSEGYPRVDIDLYRVRALRSSIARQQNDYKEVMKRIETVLPKVIPSEYQAGSINRVYTAQKNLEPFARIGIVPTESSAYKAGLCPNDLIVKFGNLTRESYTNELKCIASEFSRFKSNESELEIKVKRSDANGQSGYKDFVFDCKVVESISCQILPL